MIGPIVGVLRAASAVALLWLLPAPVHARRRQALCRHDDQLRRASRRPTSNTCKNYFPQFEEKTGIKVDFTMQAFPVYNQRTDLELSTKGSAIDVVNVTFIYSGRWIGAGWFTNLDTFTKDKKYTPAEWAPEDFVGGPQSAMQNAKGETFGYAWLAGAMMLGAARFDLIEKAGLEDAADLRRSRSRCAMRSTTRTEWRPSPPTSCTTGTGCPT